MELVQAKRIRILDVHETFRIHVIEIRDASHGREPIQSSTIVKFRTVQTRQRKSRPDSSQCDESGRIVGPAYTYALAVLGLQTSVVHGGPRFVTLST